MLLHGASLGSSAGRVAVDLAFSRGDEGQLTEPTLADTRALLEANLYNRALATPEALELRHRMSAGKNFAAFLARKHASRTGARPRAARCS